ncbi:hypothetical protein [Acanthopleuribacter pedis]|uniref:Uncharacterized protein n=1 Tax=Acanthopleuribacter pedis TaxID=442870 RepID=A0A8J7U583_9BACT|nr:hypothetical protein [Acanthopleuribacter pedis]MBO1321452.1 hypothetical protein [Acanthopleuribacter pedis]
MHATFPANLTFWRTFHDETLFLFFQDEGDEREPAVRLGEHTCHNLFDALALLSPEDPECTPELVARVANFIIFGDQFQLIDNPGTFQTRYQNALDRRAAAPDAAASHYAPYQVSGIEQPRHDGTTLTFYNFAPHNLVPYRVSVPWPLTSRQTPIQQDLLPLAPNGSDYVAD